MAQIGIGDNQSCAATSSLAYAWANRALARAAVYRSGRHFVVTLCRNAKRIREKRRVVNDQSTEEKG
jgi:hypothetical protein